MRARRRGPCLGLLLLPLLALGAAGSARAGDTVAPGELEQVRRAEHLLSRFAFGAEPALLAEVVEEGVDRWFDRQLAGAVVESESVDAALAKWPSLSMSLEDLADRYDVPPGPGATLEERRLAQETSRIPRRELVDSVLLRAVSSRRRVQEVLCDFFRNHFAVDALKTGNSVLGHERDVVQAHALGRFGDMLSACATSPAMLVFLDNVLSRRPPSKAELSAAAAAARRRGRSREAVKDALDAAKQRGLNENYARELLELHTLGVDRFYVQQDVIEVAKALTGWTVSMRHGAPVGFEFRPALHVEGAKRFLGGVIEEVEKAPVEEGREVLRRLDAHRGTAEFLSWKLCRWLVDDDPPADLVERIAGEWRRTKGDLKAVLRAIERDPEFWAPARRRAKFKRPFEFVVSALRVTRAEVTDAAALHRALERMNESIYRCQDPTGYYDQAEAWRDPGAIAERWKFAMDLVRNRIPGVRVPATLYEGMHPHQRREWREILVKRLLPGGVEDRTWRLLGDAITEALAKDAMPPVEEIGPTLAGAILGSADFQRQ
jgi:uncharacterized protein (DUF1800 family)